MKPILTVACFQLKSAWQDFFLRSALTALLLTQLGLLLAADAPKPPQAETFVTPKRDRAGMNSDVLIDKSLPNVLILGDSISIRYTRFYPVGSPTVPCWIADCTLLDR